MHVDKNKRNAIIGTILFHVLLLVALVFLALRTPLPLPGEQGVEVNFGYAAQGMGAVAGQSVKPKLIQPKLKKTQKVEKKSAPSRPKPALDKVKDLTQETEKAPSLKKEKIVKHNVKQVLKKKIVTKPVEKKVQPGLEKKKRIMPDVVTKKKKEIPPKPVLNKRALFKVPVSEKTQGQGVTKGLSDQGKQKGSENSNAYKGKGGEGHGVSYSLGDRGARFIDKPSSSFTEQGTVVVKIWVNPQGKVIKAMVYAKGTTVVDENLRRMAVKAALNSSFSGDAAAPAEQIGTITYHFILKK